MSGGNFQFGLDEAETKNSANFQILHKDIKVLGSWDQVKPTKPTKNKYQGKNEAKMQIVLAFFDQSAMTSLNNSILLMHSSNNVY